MKQFSVAMLGYGIAGKAFARILDGMEIRYVENMEQVLKAALV